MPVEKGWPLLGVLPEFLSGDPFEYLKTIMLKRGDFVQLNFGPKPVYLISHAEYLQRILRDNYQNYRKPGMLYDSAREVMGNGLVLSTGDTWLRQRRMIQPHLHRKQLVNLFSDMVDAIAEVLERWEILAQNDTEFELGEKMGELVSSIVMKTMFGQDVLPAEEVTQTSKRVLRLIRYGGETLYSAILPKWFPIPGRKQFLEDLSTVKAVVNKIIAKCRQEKETSASLIQMLINSVDEESQERMTEEQLFDEVMTIIIAGYETTATILTWLGAIIYNYPDTLEKLHAEVDQVLGRRPPTFEDIPRLAYTRQVFMEALRMYTVVPFLPRSLNEADQLGNYHLPADAMVLVFYHGVHHNPRIWDNPEVFDPERFTPESMASHHPFAYVPFSAGPRKCAGDEFALLEGTLAIAMLLQKYDLKILPNQTFPARLGSTMHPRNGIKTSLAIRVHA